MLFNSRIQLGPGISNELSLTRRASCSVVIGRQFISTSRYEHCYYYSALDPSRVGKDSHWINVSYVEYPGQNRL
ncbi:hypothetical protein PM082_016330 [Marasmius tenuissimus]|nr:hypothetical protein PM082_016330 [Marasmius tenuissimus]